MTDNVAISWVDSAPVPEIGGTAVPRNAALGMGLLLGVAIVAFGSFSAEAGSPLGVMLFDNRPNTWPPYPFTIQNLTWIAFGIGLADLGWLHLLGTRQRALLTQSVLPEDPEMLIDSKGMAKLARSIKPDLRNYFLSQVVLRSIWQFQSTRSVSQTSEIMKNSLELCEHEVDLQYSLGRFLSWFIPTLGFIGTVLGISLALGKIQIEPDDPEKMKETFNVALSDIGTAFNTTLLALLLSAVLVFLMNRLEERDERTIVAIGRYCLDNLINKIYVPHGEAQ